MGMKKLIEYLESLRACYASIKWVRETQAESLLQCWDNCEEAKWLIWLLWKELPDDRGIKIRLCDLSIILIKEVIQEVSGREKLYYNSAIAKIKRYANNARDGDFDAMYSKHLNAYLVADDVSRLCKNIDFASKVRDFFPEIREILAKKDNELGLIA